MWKIPLFDLNFDKQETDAVIEVLNSKWLTAGEKTKQFESAFAQYLGDVHCCALSSGTAALHLALLCAGIKPGDEVIVPGLTFVADLNVILLAGAVPVVADIKSLDDWNLCPKDAKAKITPKTKAMIAVHYAGWPCDMDELSHICKKNNILLIEDAAHAPGAAYKGEKCGTLGDMACFSFFSNKNLSTGEGGMLTSRNPDYVSKARLLRSHGMTSMTIDRHEGRSISYDVTMPGLNYRIDEIKSALGLVQLQKLDKSNQMRRDLIRYYIGQLEGIKAITIPWKNFPEDRMGAGHIFPILLSEKTDREAFINHLKEKGIQTSIHYPAFSDFSYYKDKIKASVKISNRVSDGVVTLPLYPSLLIDDCDFICRTVLDYFA